MTRIKERHYELGAAILALDHRDHIWRVDVMFMASLIMASNRATALEIDLAISCSHSNSHSHALFARAMLFMLPHAKVPLLYVLALFPGNVDDRSSSLNVSFCIFIISLYSQGVEMPLP